MLDPKIINGKPPSPISDTNNDNLKEENNFLKNELKKLQVKFDILTSKLYFLENQICCGCCGLRWQTTFNK